MRLQALTLGLSLLSLASACDSEAPASDEAPEIASAGGKADLADLARPLAYDAPVTGDVADGNFVLYRLEGERGDSQIELEVVHTGGSFDPRADAYTPVGTDIRHDAGSFHRMGDAAIKTVTLPFVSDDPLIAVSAHGGEGSGSYELTVRCLSGACAGEVDPVNDATPFHASICIENARDCLFNQNPAQGEGINVLATCLQVSSGIEGTCANACEGSDDARDACQRMASAAEDLSAEGERCVAVLDDCVDTCMLNEENSPFFEDEDPEFLSTGVGRCWLDPNFFGTCDEFARSINECGGERTSIDDMNYGMCFNYCEAFTGPWQSDVDETCDEFCIGEVCESLYEVCEIRCSSDAVDDFEGCFETCVEEDELNESHTGSTCSDYL
ncbi:MAG: hypothetical protein AAGA54_01570 [Myxococcota bacterium]